MIVANTQKQPFILILVGGAILLACVGCEGNGGEGERLFSPQNNQLDVYDLATGEVTVLIPSERNTVNGQACLLPDESGNFIMGEDTGQPEQRQGWGIFSPEGFLLKKIPEPQSPGEAEQPEPFGCGFDDQGRLFVTDVGTGSFGAADGKLILFFPPDYDDFCLLDTTLRTAGTVAIDGEGNVYVPESVPPGRVLRYSPPFSAGPGDCNTTPLNKSTFIEESELQTPLGMVRAPNGNWYVSSVLIPAGIHEYDMSGKFVRTIVPADTGGNPAGVAVDSRGTLYYADLALVQLPPPNFFGPASGQGTIRRVTFDAEGNPSPAEIFAGGLSFPDGVSIFSD